jgi:hypothetical protein
MTQKSISSAHSQIKFIKIALVGLFIGILFACLVASSSIKDELDLNDNEDSGPDRGKCWTQFKEQNCNSMNLTPRCKKLYECSFGEHKKHASNSGIITWLLLTIGICSILYYVLPG